MSKPFTVRFATGTAWTAGKRRAADGTAWATGTNATNPITRVGVSAGASTYAASLSIAAVMGAVAGDVSYVLVATKSGKTVTPPSGWTLVTSKSAGATICLIYRRVLDGTESASASWTIASSGSAWAIQQIVFRGVNAATPEGTPLTNGGYTTTSFGVGPLAHGATYGVVLLAVVADNATSAVFTGDPTLTLERTIHISTLALSTFYEPLAPADSNVSRGCMSSGVVQGAVCGIVLNPA